MAIQRIEGLEAIAAACDITVDELVTWYIEHKFPLRRQEKGWYTTDSAIDEWGKRRRQAERRRAWKKK